MKFLIIFIFAFLTTFSLIQFIKKNMQGRIWAYPLLLASLPMFYFIFALWINDKTVLKNEFMFGLFFFVIVGLYLRFRLPWVEYLLVGGFFAHAGYDLTHDSFFTNMGVPLWWGGFCALVNVFIGLYLLYQIRVENKLA